MGTTDYESEVPGYHSAAVPGLCIVLAPGKRVRYKVAHVTSGKTITGNFSRADARQAAELLAPLLDWTEDGEKVLAAVAKLRVDNGGEFPEPLASIRNGQIPDLTATGH